MDSIYGIMWCEPRKLDDSEILHASLVEVGLDAGEKIIGDSGAMSWMEGEVSTTTSTRGGFLAGMKRKFLSGESFFQRRSLLRKRLRSWGLILPIRRCDRRI